MKSTNKLNKINQNIIMPLTLIVLPCLSMVAAHATPPWEQTHKILASDGEIGDGFGFSVAISGNLAVIGEPLDANENGILSGSAYAFDITTGQQLFKFLAADGESGDEFGISVAASGNLVVIGAPADTDNGDASGSAYVFNITTGQQIFKLLANDGQAGDTFGERVAIDGNLAVIGAAGDDDYGDNSGSVYVFDVTTGQQLFKLHATDGETLDKFGFSVAIHNNLAVIGAIDNVGNGTGSGSAYVFDVTTGRQLFEFDASDGAYQDSFGFSVAINDNLAVIGAPFDDNDNGAISGSAYVFDITTGQPLFKLLTTDGADGDNFGYSVAISNNHAVIGTRFGDGNSVADSGSAYVFDITTGQQVVKLFAADGESSDEFGLSVAVSGNLVVIGARYDDDNGFDSGSAYIFQQQPANHLSVSPDPLIANQDGTFTITQALPNALTGLIYSLDGLQNTFIVN